MASILWISFLDRNVPPFKCAEIPSFFRTVYDSYCLESSSLSTDLCKWLLCIKHSTGSVVNALTFTHPVSRKPKVKLSSGTAFWIESVQHDIHRWILVSQLETGVLVVLPCMHISYFPLEKLNSDFEFLHHWQTRGVNWMLFKGSSKLSDVRWPVSQRASHDS